MVKFSLALLVSLLVCGQSFGTHFITCGLEAFVENLYDLAVLNDAVITGDNRKGGVQIAKIKITKVMESNSKRGGCGFKEGDTERLQVKESELGNYHKGNILELEYKNVGDHRGSRVSWDVQGVRTPSFNPNPAPSPALGNPPLAPAEEKEF